MLGYHFTADTLRDGRPIPPIGEWLVHEGPIAPCVSGLHASEHPFDALTYAPGNLLHRVELEGDLVPHGYPVDKWVGRKRHILETVDAETMLRVFARECALTVVHLWDCPPVCRQWLTTGNKDLRAAARAAARASAWAAARKSQRDRFAVMVDELFTVKGE